jgi:hypothetical protein
MLNNNFSTKSVNREPVHWRNPFVDWLVMIFEVLVLGIVLHIPVFAASFSSSTSIIGSSSACTSPTKTAKALNPIGKWEDANTWIPVGVPGANDTVLIPSGVTVTVSPLSSTKSNMTVNGVKIPVINSFCLQGTVSNEELVTFQGVKFNDLNGNGIQEPDEKGISFETIYIRNDDLVSKGLPGDYTATTDIQGQYSISGLPSGNYTVRTSVGKTLWQTAPVKATKVGNVVPYQFNVPNGTVTQEINFGIWDGVERQECSLCVVANDQQVDAGEEVLVGGSILDKAADGSDLTVIVEAFGFSTVKVIPGEQRIVGGNITATLSVSFPTGGNYPVKITVKKGYQVVAEATGNIVVRDVATSDACDISVPSIWSTRSGKWDDPTVWTGGRVPQPSDWVMIRSGHEVKLPAVTTAQIMNKEVLKVKGLCIDQNAKLGHFYYKKWQTQSLGLTSNYLPSISRQVRSSDACSIAVTKIAKKLDPPGKWNDDNTWDPTGVPGDDDKVRIPEGVAVVVPYSDTIQVNQVDSLCNEGLLMSPTELPPDNQQYWLAINANNLHNKGTIVSNDGFNGGNGVGIYLGTPNEFNNDKIIQSGNGSYPAGNGGPIRFDPNNFTNTQNGYIQLGNGANCDHGVYPSGRTPSPSDCTNNGKAGNGGELTIKGVGDVTIHGNIIAGNGGDARHTDGAELQGKASPLIIGNPAEIDEDAVVDGKDGQWFWDPIVLKIGDNVQIHSGDIYFVSDENGQIKVGNLSAGAITAERTLTWAIGSGGVIDFSQVSDKAFKAGEEVIIHADNITLPAGKTLEQLVDAPKLTVGPAKLLARADWLTHNETILGKPEETILLPLILDNLGPATDTYNLTMTSVQNWSGCKLPETVTVNSQRRVELECKVVLPPTYDAENLLTITATSQSDPTLSITSQLRLKTEAEQDELPLPNADDAVTVQDNQWTLISRTEEDVEVFPFSTTPELSEDSIRITAGSALTPDGQPSAIDIAIQSNDEIMLSDPVDSDLEPLRIAQDGSILVTNDTVQITFDTEGGFIGVDTANPQHQVIMTPDGEVMITDDTAPNVVVIPNEDGSFTGRDIISGTEVTIDQQGQIIVTHPNFPGMQAIVNPDNTLTVTDTSDPNAVGIAAIFDLETGQYQLINTLDGTCYTEDSNQRKSFWKKVTGFVSKAAGFVAKVANVITPVTNVIGQIAGTVNKVVGAIVKAAPTINTWATKLLNWACNTCHPLIAGIANFFAKATVANSGFLGILGKIQTVTGVITKVTSVIPKVATIAQRVSDWFGKFRRGHRGVREASHAVSACEIWYPISEVTPLPPADCLLYGVQDQALNDSIFFAYNPDENTVKQLEEQCSGCDIESLTIHPLTNEIYVGAGDDAVGHPKGHLYKLNPITGELYSVGDTGFLGISSLTFDSQGRLWSWAKGRGLATLNPDTAQGQLELPSSLELADLTWDDTEQVLYGVVGKELWSYAPTTGEVNQICDNLPTKTEALRVLPPQFLPEGFILLGSHHNQQLQLQVFDRVSCQRVANQDITIGYDDVEGLAMPIAACQ